MKKNPFMPGDRVVCTHEDWVHESGPKAGDYPPKGEVLTVSETDLHYIAFEKYNMPTSVVFFVHWNFAPAQDATEMTMTDDAMFHTLCEPHTETV